MSILIEEIEKAESIAIVGHTRPDGDCVGSTSALYHYIQENYPKKQLFYFLEQIPKLIEKNLSIPERTDEEGFNHDIDLFISLDISAKDRMTVGSKNFDKAKKTFVIDHHKTNPGFGDINIIKAGYSSASEVLFELLDYDKISLNTATSLYLGIVFDTGVFKYSATTESTMIAAGKLLTKGVDSAKIIDNSFYSKTWKQNKLLARAIDNAEISDDGLIAYTVLSNEEMNEFSATAEDTEGVVEQLRLTDGVEVALFLREDKTGFFKGSLRDKTGKVDVSLVASVFGGGGHAMAAGFSISGTRAEAVDSVLREIYKQL
jgi:phosphoesterase RecJ-like protein